ncbi:MAG: MCE family protein [Ignavibacteria bacterium]|nr:MCE family protein [Ignavibacteria bacterium]
MKDQRKTEIRVGITVLLGIILILWVFGWAKNLSVNSSRKELLVEFNSVAGLELNDPVTINGVRKGFVDEIKIQGNLVNVLLILDGDVELKEDAKFYIMMLDLMGGKRIEVEPGSSAIEMNYSLIAKGKFLGDISTAMAAFGTVEIDLVDVIKDVKITLESLNKTLTDEKFNSDMRNVLNNIVTLTNNLNKLINDNKKEINQLLVSGNKLADNLNEFITTNKDSIAQTIISLKQTMDHSKVLIDKVDLFIDNINQGENNLGKIINDPDLLNDLKTTIQQLKNLANLLLEQLQKEGIKVDASIDLF